MKHALPNDLDDAVAIVGLAGRLPGARSIAEFWAAVREGRELFGPHPPEALADAFTDAERAQPDYVPVRPSLDEPGRFDARFFNMLPREASVTDPQFRVFLEVCWEALEDAGHDPARPPGPIGVFGGASMSTYFLNNVLADRAAVEEFVSTYQLGDYQPFMGALSDTLATRVAFKLGLTGPAVTVATACSTSLVAVAQAVQSLRSFQCDLALAGGVSITFPQERGYFYREGGMASRDGHCRPFDAAASGTVFGHGAGVVALRRLGDALADDDGIYALIRGTGVNNDGSDKIAFTAPSVLGQAVAIAEAQAGAGIDPGSIGYVECHGTGTPLGDPIEFEGLRRAFAGVAPGRVRLGSVKANVGHLDAAAGVVGLIKTALMLRDRVIPPLANFAAPNPLIALDGSPFRIPTELNPWAEAGPLRAGVSALGVGGTNAHVVLEEAPPRSPDRLPSRGTRPHVLPISARSEAALAAMASRLADALEAPGAPDLSDAALTLQEGRRAFEVRRVVAAATAGDAAAQLRAPGRAVRARPHAPPVCFMFPGQGAQHPRMGAGLHRAEPVVRRLVSEGSALLEPLIGLDLEALVFGEADEAEAARTLRNTAVAQPALFLVEYAVARLWQDRGVAPVAMVGHSVGEFVAATLAGVMSFEAGLRLVAARGRLMQEQPRGAMLSVRAPVADAAALAPAGVDLAARNAPLLNVFAGPEPAVAAFESSLGDAGIACSRVHTSHAFHSEMMAPVVAALEAEVARIDLRPPSIPFASCVTGAWIAPSEAVDPGYWARHCRAPVQFEAAVRTLTEGETPPVLLEVGPGRTLSTFAAQALPRDAAAAVVQSLPDHARAVDDLRAMAAAHGALWAAGVPVDWATLRHGPARRVSLPTYPFERALHWVEAPVPAARRAGPAAPAAPVDPAACADPSRPQPSSNTRIPMPQTTSRTDALASRVLALLSDLSGERLTPDEAGSSFVELGFDSLLLGQVAQRLSKEFGLGLTFRQLMTEVPTVQALLAHMAAVLPAEPEHRAEAAPDAPATAAPVSAPPGTAPEVALQTQAAAGRPVAGELGALLQSQTQAMLALFESQTRALAGATPMAAPATPAPVPPAPVLATAVAAAPVLPATPGRAPVRPASGREAADRFDLNRRRAGAKPLSPEQRAFVDELCAAYSARFPASKAHAQEGRGRLADPRTAAGFRAEWKELVFPLIAERASGARIVDPDGNELVDLVNGFGQTAFGHAPPFVTAAVAAQMERGFAIGPQTPLAHEVARKFLALTGHERVTFCNTGSEAVMAAMRIARTVTGRDTVVCFKGDYHGQFDEVLVKGRPAGDPTALPAVAGVPDASVANMVVLAYGAEESLDWIRENRGEIAAILVEPVQSRHPELRPRGFCEELRRVATDCGAALVFDEIVTGFRVAPGGVQEHWGLKADLATYGKVVGGGLPVGVLAGSARFMDALDGGHWRFGDDSAPEVPPTFFAGTFVRHPLVLAAVSAVLDHLAGPDGRDLYDRVAPRTARLLDEMNDALEDRGLPRAVTGFSSWLIVSLAELDPRAALLYPLMRLGGVHVHDGYPWFFTTAHGEADFRRVLDVFTSSVDRLQAAELLPGAERAAPPAPVAVPLTEPQREIWMAAQLGDAASGVFIESCSLRLEGPLDAAALEGALNEVIARHDALRLRFAPDGAQAQVAPRLRLALAPEDMDGAALDAAIAADARTPFDLVDGPLVRARLARLAADAHVLILSYHHIVCDGWSVYLVLQELAALYNARAGGSPAELPAPASFAAFAASQAGRSPPDATAAFWRAEFPAAPDLPDLPLDAPRAGPRSFAGATHVHEIDPDLARAVKRATGRAGATMFSALAGALALMLARTAGAPEVVLAVPTAGQALLPDGRLVGHCVNLLPIRIGCDLGASLREHLGAASRRVLDCFGHGDVTYGTILRAAAIRGDINRQPLSEVQFNLDQQPDDLGFAGLRASLAGNPRAHTNFDIIFNVTEGSAGLRIDLTYATDVLSEETAARWCRQYRRLLEALVEDLDAPAGRVPLVPADEAAALVALGEGPSLALPDGARIEDLVARQAAATPDAVAVEDGRTKLTYADLMRESARVAAEVRRRVPEPGGRVAVLVERGVALVAALLGVLRAGHAYVPLDPHHPPARLRSVLAAARVSGVLHDGPRPDPAQGLEVPVIDLAGDWPASPPPERADVQDPTAYVIFTSGSTGTPKGVEVSHAAVVNLLQSMRDRPGFAEGGSLLSVTTVSFDIAALELFLPLVAGGRAVVAAASDVQEAFPLVERIARGDVDLVQATPTLWQMLLEAGLGPNSGLKILVGGEPLPRDLADRLLALGGEVWNMYGPTETTIWSSCGRVGPGGIDVGQPIANTGLHVLDAGGALAPLGVAGELNIGGAGLAKGYWDRPDLTAAAFRPVDVPGLGTRRLYRTGDLAVRRPDGSLRLLGRRDGQVKLRGFRIELGDVEAAIRSAPGVRAAAADLRAGAAGPHLVGYYVGDGEAASPAALARAVGDQLPAYMVPTRWVRLDALPQTANGKLDRRALPEPEAAEPARGPREVTAPETPLEATLAEIWSEVLGVRPIGTRDDLFDLGADSLSVFRIAARMIDRNIGLEAKHLLLYPTIAGLAAFAGTQAAEARRAPSLKDFRHGARRGARVGA